MQFKGTKGKWILKGEYIRSENKKELLCTAWNVYDEEKHEKRTDGESWLAMRERTEVFRLEAEIERKANTLLISKAPEMLEMLILIDEALDALWKIDDKNILFDYLNGIDTKGLIQEATEIK